MLSSLFKNTAETWSMGFVLRCGNHHMADIASDNGITKCRAHNRISILF